MSLSTKLDTLTQRTSSAAGSLNTSSQRQQLLRSIRSDISALMAQHNDVSHPLYDHLVDGQALNGLDGRSVYSNWEATSASGDLYWSSGLSRALTIQESMNVLNGYIVSIENQLAAISSSSFDGTNIYAFTGMAGNSDGTPDYTAHGAVTIVSDGDSLEVAIQKLDVAASGASTASIQTFVGMDSAGDTTPDYTAHGAISTVSDGDSLELGIQKLDAAVAAITPVFTIVSNVVYNNAHATDDFVIGSTQLDDDSGAGTAKDRRMFFEKSTGSFRAGLVTGTQWDSANRGTGSVAFGRNNTAAQNYSGVFAGNNNNVSVSNSALQSVILGGLSNEIGNSSASDNSSIIGGESGTVNSPNAFMIGGYSGNITVSGALDSTNSGTLGGNNPTITACKDSVSIGGDNLILGASMKDAANAAAQGLGHVLVGGFKNRSTFQGHYGIVHGSYADAGTYNAQTHGGGSFNASTRGDAQYERAVYFGQTGGTSTTNYLYLNSDVAGAANTAFNAAGYSINVQAETTAMVEWSFVGRKNNGGTPSNVFATGSLLLSRNGTAAVTIIQSNVTYATNTDSATWTGGGGQITWSLDGSKNWTVIPGVVTGSTSAITEGSACLTAKVTIVGMATP